MCISKYPNASTAMLDTHTQLPSKYGTINSVEAKLRTGADFLLSAEELECQNAAPAQKPSPGKFSKFLPF